MQLGLYDDVNLWYDCFGGILEREMIWLLENKLGISDMRELAHVEERLTKKRALELYDKRLLDTFEVGTYAGLKAIHGYLFQDVYDFARQTRTVNIAKGHFRFAPVLYLDSALENIEAMPEDTHPFREGNGRSTRIWLDAILKRALGMVIDWSDVDKEDYLFAMERSVIRDKEIKALLKAALTTKINDRQVYMKGIDASYRYEGYNMYKTEDC